jgi:hypothetical protein
MNHEHKGRKELQTKVIENILNKIIAEKFPNIEKEKVFHAQEAFRTPDNTRKDPLHIIL